jgi:DNA polymerase III epsilon subunit-like protein
MKKSQIISFCDTETGGLDFLEHELLQIAVVKAIHPKDDPANIQLLEGGCREWKIKPTKPVDPAAAALNGYDPEVWEREARPLDEVMLEFLPFIEWTNFGGQNPHFDKGFLTEACRKCDLPWPRMQGYRLIAVEMLAWPLLLNDKIENVKQETLMKYFGLGGQSHDALDDIRNSIEIYKRLVKHAVDQTKDFEP